MGLDMSLGSLPRLSHAKSPSLSAENPTGGKGQDGPATEGIRLRPDAMRCQIDQWFGEGRWPEGAGFDEAREFGVGWKVSPNIIIGPDQRQRGDPACQDDNGSGRQRRITVGIGAKSSP